MEVEDHAARGEEERVVVVGFLGGLPVLDGRERALALRERLGVKERRTGVVRVLLRSSARTALHRS